MKKSEQQLKKELGSWHNIKGYFFRLVPNNKFIIKWELHETVSALEWRLDRIDDFSYGIYGWRKQQTDWQSVNNLILYDRFGSRICLNENSVEIKLTDIGKQYDDLQRLVGGYMSLFDDAEKRYLDKMKQLEIQFPIKED